MKKLIYLIIVFFLSTVYVTAQLRSLNDIFPGMNNSILDAALSDAGYINSVRSADKNELIGFQNNRLDPQITNIILSKNPGFIAESIIVIYGRPGEITLLSAYNALLNIRDLKGRLYDSYSKNEAVPLFEDATRILSERQTTAIADPPPASFVPSNEVVFIRLKDANFGNSFYKAEIVRINNGLRYTLTNFRSLTYFFIPVIREGNFAAQLYLEPISEGILLYSIAGANVSDFFSSRIHMNSAISKRLSVLTSWAKDGIQKNR